ncbi:MAG: iron ABC transporter permease [Thermodesulfobacteriota bacterium]|jgi:iron(III) transport system permease protein
MKQLFKEPVVLIVTLVTFGILFYFVAYPLYAVFRESVMDEGGNFVGLTNYASFVKSEYFRQVFYNTLFISVISTIGAVLVGIIFAFGMTRTDIPWKWLFMVMAILPMITPPFINAFALILLLGRNGVVNVFLERWLGFKFVIYGYHGVILSEILTTFPLAYLIISAAFSGLDSTLEDSAQDLGAQPLAVLRTVTLPLITPAILTATLMVFMTNLSAFGAPALLGGGISVLAVESVIQTLGVLDWGMGTTLSVVLLIPSFLLFYFQSWYRSRRSYVTITGQPAHTEIRKTPWKIKGPILGFCLLMSGVILITYLVVLLGGFSRVWGVDSSFTLAHYRLVFTNTLRSITNSLILSSIGALLATLLGLLTAYLIVRQSFPGRRAMDFLGTLPYAVPGTMMGLGFVVAFNKAPLILTGTAFILVLDYCIRRMPFGLRSGVSTLKQIDVAMEEASADLGASWLTTFRKIVLPLMKPAFIAGITFSFIRAITELTSTIFLVTPRWRVMAVDIYNMVESGALGGAAAMSTLLMAIVVIILLVIYRATGATASMFRM